MDANVRTGRREKRRARSKDEKNLRTYGRDGVDDNGVLSFSSITKGDVLHTLSTGEAKNMQVNPITLFVVSTTS